MLWVWTLAASLALMTVVWAFSVPMKDTSLVDRFWGIAFVVMALTAFLVGETTRGWLVVPLAFWAGRLSWHITRRNWGKPEDARYAAWRAQHGDAWPWRSLVTVFWFQALLAWIVAAPIWWLLGKAGDASMLLDVVGASIVVASILLEALADGQLRRLHVSGTIMDRGIWKYSRHPNYFFEATIWWGFWVIAVGHGAWWTIASPIVMTAILRFVSTPILEKSMETRPGWSEYVRRTNAFVPWLQRK